MVVQGTVVAVDFSNDDETLITISVPPDTKWGYEAVSIVRAPKYEVPAGSHEPRTVNAK